MIVMKFGGSSLKDFNSIHRTAEIIKENSFSNRVVVVSALFGITNLLEQAVLNSVKEEQTAEKTINKLKEVHCSLAQDLIENDKLLNQFKKEIDTILDKTERMLKGIFYTGEATLRIKDAILSTGERLSAFLMAGCLESIGVNAVPVQADKIGIIAEGDWGNGTAVIKQVRGNVAPLFKKLMANGTLPIVTGFFGETESGDTITFGRGGSDYSASVLARALKASYLEIWKDVEGFLTGAPDIVEDAKLLTALSYEEAAELAYFGAKILHPRTVEPLAEKGIPIVIRSIFHPESAGTWISSDAYIREGVAKSVTYDRNVGLLRIYGPNIGYAFNLLSEIVSSLRSLLINIRSVFTSQTCINILLNRNDLVYAYNEFKNKKLVGIDEIEKRENLGLVAIVGYGMADAKESISQALSCLTENGIDVELVISGASRVASYFIVKEKQVYDAIFQIHKNLFGTEEVNQKK